MKPARACPPATKTEPSPFRERNESGGGFIRRGFVVSTIMYIFFMIIFMALLISFGYKWYTSQNKTVPPTSSVPPEVTEQKADTVNETVYTEASRSTNWKTYTAANFLFKYPPNFKLNSKDTIELFDENGNLFLSIFSFNPAIVGISYCGAYPNDKARCEQLKVGGNTATIDWDMSGKANAILENLSITLHKTDTQTKILFRRILSTFRFTN